MDSRMAGVRLTATMSLCDVRYKKRLVGGELVAGRISGRLMGAIGGEQSNLLRDNRPHQVLVMTSLMTRRCY